MRTALSTLGLITLLVLLFSNNTFAAKFADVPSQHWAYEAIGSSVEAGILQGYDGKFHGNKTLNRYEIACIVARLLDKMEETTVHADTKEEEERIAAITDVLLRLRQELAELNKRTDAIETDLVAMVNN